jgi:hypothetical protein
MRLRSIGLTGCLVLAALIVPPAGGQEQAREDGQVAPQRIERFTGTLEVGSAGERRTVAVVLANWIVPNLQRVARFPVSGLTLVEVRGGEMTAAIGGGEATEYEEGSWLLVPAGATLSLETGDDSVALETLSVSPRGAAE